MKVLFVKRTSRFDFKAVSTSYSIESSQAWLVAKVVPGESQAFLHFLWLPHEKSAIRTTSVQAKIIHDEYFTFSVRYLWPATTTVP